MNRQRSFRKPHRVCLRTDASVVRALFMAAALFIGWTHGCTQGWRFSTYRFLASEMVPDNIATLFENEFAGLDSATRHDGAAMVLDVSAAAGAPWPSPFSVGGTTRFVALFAAQFVAPTEATYEFRLRAGAGTAVLFINGTTVCTKTLQ